MHCLAYSDGAMSVGIETFGRTSYLERCFCGLDLLSTLGLISKSVGEVALLERDDRAEEASSISVVMDDAIEFRALCGLRCPFPSDMSL